ncbi:ABC transporter permease [Aureimonas phyllosphaerae]|uniref:Autoinducer 2 import system permease protein LsrC n=1 Tax=Aureimonas phyllosphaerae TaxID=1166078 RepID=A0A7W6FTF0_9HYPH|nr:ABC transporter permease [Aureimonas phyllosphaerae]MBB3934936.1 ribose/xylose/arabinose/galactoside ABC-type transport system permease subunit [Aureimonas phyllosphaerae]MBB3958944.1 ribose/xylose/arabinose/galactoside ABC-type transport system permease subunit [Aureimonas phyllosphaerae]SFF40501.1 monosaccharide ABC transporter membrane protein, CUT2 family [Aureimonas phyllosphaerae]
MKGPTLSRRLSSSGQELLLVVAIAALFLVVGWINPRFVSQNNLTSIFVGNAYIAVAAIGMSMVIISGHIDVSVGALIGVLATVSGILVTSGYPVWLSWLLPILIGGVVNAGLGALIAYLKVPSIIATLAMLSILRGGLITVTGGAWISGLPPEFQLAQFRLFDVPSPVWFMIVMTIGFAFMLRSTAFGRAIYAVGGNPEAAEASGIPYKATIVKVFALHGLIAGVAAILFATQLQVIQSTVPNGLELIVITASVVGGVSILGGIGTVVGSTLAAILFAAIGSSLIFLNVSAYWLRAVQGILILATVLADMARRGRAS